MLTATIGTALLLSQAALGGHGHHSARPEACDACGSKDRVVIESLLKLQTSPRWRERDDAANDLRDVDWRLHPEVVEALSYALLNDPEEEVREEAAESLTKLAPCHPVARAALARAAECDRDYATRHWARKGLKAVGKSCKKGCDVCEIGGGAEGELVVPGPGLEPGLIPGETILRGEPLVPGQPFLGPGFDAGMEPGMIPSPPPPPSGATIPLESIPLVPPAGSGPGETPPSPLPIPPLESSDDSLEPLPLEAPTSAAAAASAEKPAKLEETKMVKPVKHEEESKREAQGRKRSLTRILRFPASLFDR